MVSALPLKALEVPDPHSRHVDYGQRGKGHHGNNDLLCLLSRSVGHLHPKVLVRALTPKRFESEL